MTNFSIEVENLSKRFRLHRETNQTLKAAIIGGRRHSHDEFWALRDVSFRVPQGGALAVLGQNGSGKSTLLKCLAKILFPESGTITTRGRMAALLEIGSGFHPELSGRDNIFLNAAILGIPKAEIRKKFDDIVDLSGVERFIDQPVKNYSSGMYIRLAFSVAINVEPDVLLLDEVLAVGDASFQQRSREKFAELTGSGRTIVLVSHSLPTLTSMCDTALWLEKGKVRDFGETTRVVTAYEEALRPQAWTDASGRSRWGSGEVTVTEVDVLDGLGRTPRGAFAVGDAVTLRIGYEADAFIAEPQFTIVLYAPGEVEVWRGSSAGAKQHGSLSAGTGYFDFHIPALPLAGGDFGISTIVVDQSTQTIVDFVRNINQIRTRIQPPNQLGHVGLQPQWGPMMNTTSSDTSPQTQTT